MSHGNEKGLAMPIVLIIMFVLTLLGSALWQYSVADTMQVSRDEHRMQALYVARSGADAIAEKIIDYPQQIGAFWGQSTDEPVKFGPGEFSLEITGSDFDSENIPARVAIKSTGEVAGISEIVTLNLARTTGTQGEVVYGNVITLSGEANNDNNDNKGIFEGPVHYGTENGWQTSDSWLDEDYGPALLVPSSYPDAVFPGDEFTPLFNGDGIIKKETATITQDSQGSLIELNNKHQKVNVQMGLDAKFERHVKVDRININGGSIVLEGKGHLYLYVDEVEATGNFINTSEPDAFITICVNPGGSFSFSGDTTYNGAIYGPSATIDVGGNTTLFGWIISDKLVGGNSTKITYNVNHGSDGLSIVMYQRRLWQ
ncbi:MAG: pilus assembly PilX N-terminal domain-containing protein [Firmicutes bacterium]|nr:pilus assembly PilX N-terminal domain-containing protein [Bacillota bacterium]